MLENIVTRRRIIRYSRNIVRRCKTRQ